MCARAARLALRLLPWPQIAKEVCQGVFGKLQEKQRTGILLGHQFQGCDVKKTGHFSEKALKGVVATSIRGSGSV
jgi:hypothetical protein